MAGPSFLTSGACPRVEWAGAWPSRGALTCPGACLPMGGLCSAPLLGWWEASHRRPGRHRPLGGAGWSADAKESVRPPPLCCNGTLPGWVTASRLSRRRAKTSQAGRSGPARLLSHDCFCPGVLCAPFRVKSLFPFLSCEAPAVKLCWAANPHALGANLPGDGPLVWGAWPGALNSHS